MGRPVFLVENLFSTTMFPNHTISAEEEASGHPVEYLANGRRWPGNYWTSTTANDPTHATSTFDRVRGFDMIVLDRGHNLAGLDFELRGSSDGFTTYETILDITLPAVSAPGDLDSALGVMTEEGAWVKRFDLRAYNAVRAHIPAMGAGLTPWIVGLHVGKSYSPLSLLAPWDEDGDDIFASESVSTAGWLGRGKVTNRRSGVLNFDLPTITEYELVRYHLQSLYGSGRPMWIVMDEEQAERALLAVRPQGHQGFAFVPGSRSRGAQVAHVEYEPLRDAA
jgi:hypothetical protein